MGKIKKELPLGELKIGDKCIVKRLVSKGQDRRRMLDLGIVTGTKIEVVLRSFSGSPMAYLIRGALIALRNEDANKIMVKPF